MRKLIGIGIILLGFYLEYLWLKLCFEVVIVGIILLIFAAGILFFPLKFFFLVGANVLVGGKLNRENFRYQYYNYSNTHGFKDFTSVHTLNEYYKTLESSEDDDMATIKKNYRRLIRQYHYDTLVSQGLSQEELDKAQEKTKELNEAYDAIKKARGTST